MILELENLNTRPATVKAFAKWLKRAYDAIERWQTIELDLCDFDFAAAVTNHASSLARRFGAGDLSAPHATAATHSQALCLLGKLMVWCDQQTISSGGADREVTIREAAELLGVGQKTVTKYVRQGLLIARDAAPPSSARPLWKLPLDAVLELRGGYVALSECSAPASARRESPHLRRPISPCAISSMLRDHRL